MISPTLESFKKKINNGNLIPIFKKIDLDLTNPSLILKNISSEENVYLLESYEGPLKWSRYSFIGFNPKLIISSKKNRITIKQNHKIKKINGDIFIEIKKIMKKYKPVVSKSLPRFYGGLVGFFSYDIISEIEKIPRAVNNDTKFPDCSLMLSDSLIILDNVKNSAKIVVNVEVKKNANLEKIYNSSIKKINDIEKKIKQNSKITNRLSSNSLSKKNKILSNFKSSDFIKAVKRIKKYVNNGDVIQTVISQRWVTKYEHDPIDLYSALRELNPSPYMFYIKNKNNYIIGASPEVLVRVDKGVVETRPIAGTKPRGKNKLADKNFERDLLKDPKEKAEHIMLVDLARNDMSKVCNYGSVKVTDMMSIERYSHVMHIVSNVKGILNKNNDSIDVFKACFPAGTLSGAPKIRAMQIISELEPNNRGPYGGSVGYFGFSGNMDMSITIRSFYINNSALYFQAGAGIVADSNPKMELKETINKSGAMLKAINKTYE
tara:strand:- start:7779 stop:9251 length:1473 start_codon:yes stop_codon:yes gene_type:complete